MEFINEVQIREDENAVNEALLKMQTLAKSIISSGINVSGQEVFKVAIGKLTVSMIFQAEARHRTNGNPKYVFDEALSLAVKQANKHANAEREARKNTRVLYRLKPEKFKMDENCVFSYKGDLIADLTTLNTRKLNESQIKLAKGVETFMQSLTNFNKLLEEASLHREKIDIKVPLTNHLSEVDLKKISFIDYEEIESKKQQLIQAGIREKEVRREQKTRLERLYKNHPNKEEEVLKFLSFDPDGSKYDDDFHKNLIEPTKGTFLNRAKRLN